MGIFKKSFLELVGVIAVLVIVLLIFSFFAGEDEGYSILRVKIKGQELDLEVADNSFLQQVGLSGRESLEENQGMIFVYDYEMEELGFWMKDTLIPLDILFLNKDLEIVHVIEKVEICEQDPCEVYKSEQKAQYVIEVNAGWVEKNEIEIGDKVEIITPSQSDS